MASHPTNPVLPAHLKQLIAPPEVWTHLSQAEQQAVYQTLTRVVQASLQRTAVDKIQEKAEDGFKSEY